MPTSGGLGNAIRNGKEIGCTAVQVFTSNPRQWKGKDITDEIKEDFFAERKETGIDSIISHDTYLINLCAPKDEVREKSKTALIEEMHRCSLLEIPYTISHMGAHLNQGEEIGLQKVAEYTKIVLDETPDNVHLCMETTAGQGSSLDYKFEHLASILDQCNGHKRLVVCLDTCHIFAAGYDITSQEVYEQTFNAFEKIVGIDRLKVIHCNDSKKPLGSRVDRHEHIGDGFIGAEAFKLLVNDSRFENIPIILETPQAEEMHQHNLKKLKSFIQ